MMKKISRGFTLIEIMVVMIILGILAAVVIPKVVTRPEQARMLKVKQDIMAIDSAIQMYYADSGVYPSQAQGLQALLVKPAVEPVPTHYQEGGYLSRLPKDPWGKPYDYRYPGMHGTYDVFTQKPQAKSDEFLGNWNVE